MRRLTALGLVGIALAAALVPWPPDSVELSYARWWYPALQARLTATSNRVPFALFDGALLTGALAVAGIIGRMAADIRQARLPTWRAVARAATRTGVLAASAYLWFLISWGANYARPPIERRLALPDRPVTAAEVARLLTTLVEVCNREVAPAHAAGFPGPGEVPPALVRALHATEQAEGRARLTVPARPKHTWLGPYFRAAGVDGMLAPMALETLLAPDLTPPERPFVLAHEWAHLSGVAPEADASFMALEMARRADAPSRYSAALALLVDTAAQVPAARRAATLSALVPAVRQDLAASAARVAAGRVRLVEGVAWRAYDGYLRAQGVDDGVRDYSRVVSLVIRAGGWPRD